MGETSSRGDLLGADALFSEPFSAKRLLEAVQETLVARGEARS